MNFVRLIVRQHGVEIDDEHLRITRVVDIIVKQHSQYFCIKTFHDIHLLTLAILRPLGSIQTNPTFPSGFNSDPIQPFFFKAYNWA